MEREQDVWVSQFRKGVVELAVLGLLAREPRYGSQIVDDLAAQPALAISSGTVYPLLARLKKSGLVDSAWQESPVGPPRKYYRLTDAGVRALDGMAADWRAVATTLNSLLEER